MKGMSPGELGNSYPKYLKLIMSYESPFDRSYENLMASL